MPKYDPQKIERKWQKVWDAKRVSRAADFSKKEKFYLLFEFPYPSADGLHVGHCRPYVGLDVIVRKRRMEGQNVLFPIGWDAFGLPTENYAIKTGVHPALATKRNTGNFRRQMKMLGLSLDWSREINTTDPAYYRLTQWIFVQLFKKGLAYKASIDINWCPKDKTGLANEEVVNGKCERCGTSVERRKKDQWLIKITQYADRLLDDLKLVDYPERVKTQQQEWIGRSEGVELKFSISNAQFSIDVFTTRPDTLFGCTFLVLAPEHPLVEQAKGSIKNWDEVARYVKAAKNMSELARQEEKEKTGVELKGIKAVNPANKKEIPVFIADYVLPEYGTGAVMAVPAHDERDFAFAKKYNLPIEEVVIPKVIDQHDPPRADKKTVEREAVQVILINQKDQKVLCLKWKKFPWTTFITGGMEMGENPIEAARREILEETGYQQVKYVRTLGGPVESHFFANHKDENRKALFHALAFELIGVQRRKVSEKEEEIHECVWMTWEDLQKDKNVKCSEYDIWLDRFFKPEHAFSGEGVLINSGRFDGMDSGKARQEVTKFVGGKKRTQYHLRDWVFSRQHYWGEPIPMVFCEKCGWVPIPEKDLPVELPNVKAYHPTDTGESPLSAIEKFVKTKCPACGGAARRETDTMPNWAGSNWYYLAYTVPNISNFKFQISNSGNSAKNFRYWMPVDWYNGGMEHTTLHLLYSRFIYKFLWDIGAVPKQLGPEPYKKRTSHGYILGPGGVKMSKSRGNVINPDDVVKQYGADTMRVYELFIGPFEQTTSWDEKGIVGSRRFLEKVHSLCHRRVSPVVRTTGLAVLLNKTVRKITDDIEQMKFNTAVASLMEFANAWQASETGLGKKETQTFLKLLLPFAPHLAEELWRVAGGRGLCAMQPWPMYSEKLAVQESIFLIVQVNGKVRDKVEIAAGLTQKEIERIVLELPRVKQFTGGGKPKKVVFVPKKLMNIVV